MKIGIFAASKVGHEIIKILIENDAEIGCLIVDKNDEFCSKIINDSNSSNTIFYSDLENSERIPFLKKLDLDLGILAWWPHIIKKQVIDLFPYGVINTHPSFLPYNRGKHYYFWNIVEQVPFGVSIHYVNEDIDNGDIAFQKGIEVNWEDTGCDLWEKAQTEMIRLFNDNIDQILSGNIPRVKQKHEDGSFHYNREMEQLINIDLNQTYLGKDLINIIRGCSGFDRNCPYFYDNGKKYCINVIIKEKRE